MSALPALGMFAVFAALVAPAPRPYVVGCDGQASGGLPADYRAWSLATGPLALYSLAGSVPYDDPRFVVDVPTDLRQSLAITRDARERRRLWRALARAERGRFAAFEADAIVERDHRVTVTVAPGDRPHLAFLFDRRTWRSAARGYRVADGEPAIAVHGCPGRRVSRFHGGFVADRPGCFGLDVRVDGAAAPRRLTLSVAGGDCGALKPLDAQDPDLPLAPPRDQVRAGCARARIACPKLLPASSEQGPDVRDMTGRSRAGVLLDVEDPDAVEAPSRRPYGAPHVVLGTTRRELPLLGGRGTRWPPRWSSPSPPGVLRIAAREERVPIQGTRRTFLAAQRPTVIGPALVGDRPALLLRSAPYPRGGIHGGHVMIVWNDDRGRGRMVSLHYDGAPLRKRLRAALAVARSWA